MYSDGNMHVTIPAEFSRKHLILEAEGALSIEHADLDRFSKHMPVFIVRCGSMLQPSRFVDFAARVRDSGHRLLAVHADESSSESDSGNDAEVGQGEEARGMCGFRVQTLAAPMQCPFHKCCCLRSKVVPVACKQL